MIVLTKELLEQLQNWEQEAGLLDDEVMGKLTVLAAPAGNWPRTLREAASLMSGSRADCAYCGSGRQSRLSISKKDNESFYTCAPDNLRAAVPLLTRSLPLLYGEIIFLHELDLILSARNLAVSRGKKRAVERYNPRNIREPYLIKIGKVTLISKVLG
ncbi:MAG: hypothetical protein PHO01_09490 [Desulfotomaculaceae bacterium]|nr:hypothetical protein [Desulfotomaculaceae bacterium]